MITFRTKIQVSANNTPIGTLELDTYQPISRYQVQNAAHQALKRLNAIPDKSERTLDRYAKLMTAYLPVVNIAIPCQDYSVTCDKDGAIAVNAKIIT